jgi:hypothetical protein
MLSGNADEMPLGFSVPSTYAIDAVGAKSVVENGSGS